MNHLSTIMAGFIAAIQKDPRIGLSHIGLFAAVASIISKTEKDYLEMFGREIMLLAKISSCATYHKLIHDLDSFGYLKYEPSYWKGRPSRISLRK